MYILLECSVYILLLKNTSIIHSIRIKHNGRFSQKQYTDDYTGCAYFLRYILELQIQYSDSDKRLL